MHKGFYEELDSLKTDYPEADFGFLENESIEEISAYEFLHGFCDIFAFCLNEIFGYEMECIMNENSLVHAYCKTSINNKIYFIDVRGITDNYEEFIDEFSDFIEFFDSPTYPLVGTESIKNYPKINNNENFLKYQKIAKNIISNYKDYYKI